MSSSGRPGVRVLPVLGVLAVCAVSTVVPMSSAPAQGAAADTSFTIAAVPDTQEEILRDGNPLLPQRYRWLVANRDRLNLAYVAQSGDNVNWGAVDPAQFARASAATRILDDAGIRYGNAVGNHDTAAVRTGGSAAPGDVHAHLRDTTAFNRAFPLSRYRNVAGTFEPGKVDNMYQTFVAGRLKWLILTHEMWPRQSVLDWAKKVVAGHPRYNVVINTHAYIDYKGDRPSAGNYGDRNARVEWRQLISRYPNIKIVLSGHYGGKNGYIGAFHSDVRGVHGNKIAQIMTAYDSSFQDHTRLLRIDTAAGSISSSVYVARSTHSGYPAGYITDRFSNFVTTGMNWVRPAR